MPLIVNEDALSPNASHIRELKKHNLHYILGVKPGDHKFLFNFVEDAAQDGRTNEFEIKENCHSKGGVRNCCRRHIN